VKVLLSTLAATTTQLRAPRALQIQIPGQSWSVCSTSSHPFSLTPSNGVEAIRPASSWIPLDKPGPRLAWSARRVRGWRLGCRLGSLFAPRFLWECLNRPCHVPVSIPCHLEPYVRFYLIRLSDNLLPAAIKVLSHMFLRYRRTPTRSGHTSEWLGSTLYAKVDPGETLSLSFQRLLGETTAAGELP
jgi:hypothetical protein